MDWKTDISKEEEGKFFLRGFDLNLLIQKTSFDEAIFLTLLGRLPKRNEKNVFNSLLISCIDHGIEPASVIATRCATSTGNSINNSVATGINSLGKYHGCAIEECAKILILENDACEIVKEKIDNKKIIYGFGHKKYKDFDPRAQILLQIAKENGLFKENCKKAIEIEHEIEKKKGKKLCLNVDGAIAAILLDIGFENEATNSLFIISRTVGLCAHSIEESKIKKVRRLE